MKKNGIWKDASIVMLVAVAAVLSVQVFRLSSENGELADEVRMQMAARKAEAAAEGQRLAKVILAAGMAAQARNNRMVTATAYTASVDECDSDPTIGAAGRTMRPGQIAVSRDLAVWGAGLGTRVRVEDGDGNNLGLYTVADFMNRRYTDRIDFFFGEGEAAKEKARDFGKRQVRIFLVGDIEDTCSLPATVAEM